MLKKLILILSIVLFLGQSAQAGSTRNLEDSNIFMYLYSPKCKYCVLFSPHYDYVSRKYSKYFTFCKYNTQTKEGAMLLKQAGGYYVPYVLMMNKNKNRYEQILPSCLIDERCIEQSIVNFLK